jgi:ATP-dependent DNA helicase RecG
MKEDARERLKSGQTDIVFGTHALIQDTVGFARLGFVVVDEQHRF